VEKESEEAAPAPGGGGSGSGSGGRQKRPPAITFDVSYRVPHREGGVLRTFDRHLQQRFEQVRRIRWLAGCLFAHGVVWIRRIAPLSSQLIDQSTIHMMKLTDAAGRHAPRPDPRAGLWVSEAGGRLVHPRGRPAEVSVSAVVCLRQSVVASPVIAAVDLTLTIASNPVVCSISITITITVDLTLSSQSPQTPCV